MTTLFSSKEGRHTSKEVRFDGHTVTVITKVGLSERQKHSFFASMLEAKKSYFYEIEKWRKDYWVVYTDNFYEVYGYNYSEMIDAVLDNTIREYNRLRKSFSAIELKVKLRYSPHKVGLGNRTVDMSAMALLATGDQ